MYDVAAELLLSFMSAGRRWPITSHPMSDFPTSDQIVCTLPLCFAPTVNVGFIFACQDIDFNGNSLLACVNTGVRLFGDSLQTVYLFYKTLDFLIMLSGEFPNVL